MAWNQGGQGGGGGGGGGVASVNGDVGPAVVLTASDVSALPASQKGAANGVAPLDAGSLVPAANSLVQSVNGLTGIVAVSTRNIPAQAPVLEYKLGEAEPGPYANTGSAGALNLSPQSGVTVFRRGGAIAAATFFQTQPNGPGGCASADTVLGAIALPLSVSVWVRPTADVVSGVPCVFMKSYWLTAQTFLAPFVSWGFYFFLASLRPQFQVAIAGVAAKVIAEAYDAILINQWSLLTGTYDGTALRLYINGYQVKTASASGAIDYTNNGPVIVGGDNAFGGGDNFAGMLQYARAQGTTLLSAGDIEAYWKSCGGVPG